jgi:acetyltransferase-like isoleucine patch superfamily enzyme
MFSRGIHIWATDGHAILDKDTKEILNKPKHPLTIGDNCWIGQDVRITKGAIIPDNTIVGVAAAVTRPFTEQYTAIAGNPAKVIKRGVVWDRRDLFSYD